MKTAIEDIEKLERLLRAAYPNLSVSLVADWKAMRGEIERLTKERDDVHVIFTERNTEMWLVKRADDGTLSPIGKTGFVHTPSGWRGELEAQKAKENK